MLGEEIENGNVNDSMTANGVAPEESGDPSGGKTSRIKIKRRLKELLENQECVKEGTEEDEAELSDFEASASRKSCGYRGTAETTT